MMSDPSELRQIQRWMQAVITHPDGVRRGIESDMARAAVDVESADVEQIIDPSRSLTGMERLQIYAQAYFARLLECLRDEFPAVVQAVGSEAFDGFAFGYLREYPSRSYTLAQLGASFPKYLQETRPPDSAGAMADWTDFVIDLARLERSYSEVFDGPGVEREPLLTPEQLAAIGTERWPEVHLVSVPCLRLMTFRFPVHEYATAVRRGEDVGPPFPMPTYLAITRRDFVVRRIALTRAQFELLSALHAGASISESIARSCEAADVDVEAFAAQLERSFREWAANGFFWKAELPSAG